MMMMMMLLLLESVSHNDKHRLFKYKWDITITHDIMYLNCEYSSWNLLVIMASIVSYKWDIGMDFQSYFDMNSLMISEMVLKLLKS